MDHGSDLVRLATTVLFASIWQSVVLAACTEVFLRFAPNVSAKIRFRLWSATFFVCCLLPVIELAYRALMPVSSSSVAANMTGSISINANFAHTCLLVWGVATTASLIRLVSGLWAVHALMEMSAPAPVSLASLKDRIVGSNVSFVKLLVSDRIAAPVLAGFINSAVILPESFVGLFPEEHLASLLQHEGQHLMRRDPWTTLAFRILRALFPLNPALWYIDRRLAIAREIACDDGVLEAGVPPESYASCLAQVAELAFHHRSDPLVSGFLGRQSQIYLRVDRVLSPRTASAPAFAFSTCTATALIVLAVFLLGVPDLVNLPEPASVQSSSTVKSSPEPSDDSFDYLASPFGSPSTPSVRPPSMPVFHFPRGRRHRTVTDDLRKASKG